MFNVPMSSSLYSDACDRRLRRMHRIMDKAIAASNKASIVLPTGEVTAPAVIALNKGADLQDMADASGIHHREFYSWLVHGHAHVPAQPFGSRK